MNKKIFLKLGIGLVCLSLVACGQKNNLSSEDNSSKSSTSQSVSNTQDSVKESVKTTPPSNENSVENKQEDEWLQEDIQQDTQENENKNELFVVAGGHNTVPEVCEYYLDEINVTSRITPSIITANSSYYNVETDGNIYIDVIFYVNSLSNESKIADDLITTKIKINNNEYQCFSLVESADESDLEKNATIIPLEIRKFHFVAEVPRTDSTGELEIILTINGKNFSNKFHLEGMMS